MVAGKIKLKEFTLSQVNTRSVSIHSIYIGSETGSSTVSQSKTCL